MYTAMNASRNIMMPPTTGSTTGTTETTFSTGSVEGVAAAWEVLWSTWGLQMLKTCAILAAVRRAEHKTLWQVRS